VCGIAGYVHQDQDGRADASMVRKMCDTIVHRGPDDEGFYVKGPAGLGMRRLSIIDVSGGHQPIHNEDQNIWIVFNGEIYNFQELRPSLEKSGHRFYTNTDSETIVHLYEEHGLDFVRNLRGMFAIALYDEKKRLLVLARDRFGKKPVHYAVHHGRFFFGSEIKTILSVAPELAEVSRENLLDYFYFGYVLDPKTAFTKIHKLPPGHLLTLQDSRVEVRRYWDLSSEFSAEDSRSEDECLVELERELAEAVRIRMVSDVPLGAQLSGGVDSSIIVALMRQATAGPVKTFSISFPGSTENEAQYARAVARHFETEHFEIPVEPDIWNTLDHLTRSLEEPIADSTIIPQFHLSRMTRQHVTVALSGDGGDELFAGYERYRVACRRRKFDLGFFGTDRVLNRIALDVLSSGFPGRRLLYNLTLPMPDRYLDSVSFLPVLCRERSIFSDDFLHWAKDKRSPYDEFRRHYDQGPTADFVNRLLYLDMKTNLPGDILTKVDRMSMAASLEVRCPLLDHRLAEWAARLGPQWKLRNGSGKYLLRKLAERLGVSHEVMRRPKHGFTLPLAEWMRTDLKNDLPRLLLDARTINRGYFKPKAIEAVLEEHFRGQRDQSSIIWALLMFEMWHRNFLEAHHSTAQSATTAPDTLPPSPGSGWRGEVPEAGSAANCRGTQ